MAVSSVSSRKFVKEARSREAACAGERKADNAIARKENARSGITRNERVRIERVGIGRLRNELTRGDWKRLICMNLSI
jgi:hypothetical protein